MKEKLAKLVNVKSIITLILCGVFAYLSIMGKVASEQFLTIFTVIISFYFGTQATKEKEESVNG
nr:MAG TPA: hypothetical protein [Caudoviricetes sp.]